MVTLCRRVFLINIYVFSFLIFNFYKFTYSLPDTNFAGKNFQPGAQAQNFNQNPGGPAHSQRRRSPDGAVVNKINLNNDHLIKKHDFRDRVLRNNRENVPINQAGQPLNANGISGKKVQNNNVQSVQQVQNPAPGANNYNNINNNKLPENPSHAESQSKRKSKIKLSSHPICKDDIEKLCLPKDRKSNFGVLECLQNSLTTNQFHLNEGCQHLIWQYKSNLTKDIRFDSAASEVCKEDLSKLAECNKLEDGTGHKISCLIENQVNITSQACHQFIVKMSAVVFSDYRLIYKFTDSCGVDIDHHKCGRVNLDEGMLHSQGGTLECLSKHVKGLNSQCKHEILRIAEIQADDYHMDRPLFYACREDREKFCKRTRAGSGKIYKCLIHHKFDREMSKECREKIVLRQKLTRENYKVNKGLAENCRHDIRANKCFHKTSVPQGHHAKMSLVLLCLEGAENDGVSLMPECVSELREIRRSLMEDYQISPNIVLNCETEINEHCHKGLERGGKTLHCLMDLARPLQHKNQMNRLEAPISAKCRRELEELLHEADPASDYRVDPALHEACAPIVETACSNYKPDDPNILSCLMNKIDSKHMNPECKEKLMELQYFMARDFRLDPRLYRHCHKDATEKCGAPKHWFDTEKNVAPEMGPLVLACLHNRIKYHSNDPHNQISRACSFEVTRVMRQRAISVELEPLIEQACLSDLSIYCSSQLGKGEEIECLQDNFEKLSKPCQIRIGNFTEDEGEDPNLSMILKHSCTPMIHKFCQDPLTNQDAEGGADESTTEVLQCLIAHKHHPDMNEKCAAGILHHQLIHLKDYRFTHTFKEACKRDVMMHCKKSTRRKSEIVMCLSETVRNDTLLDSEHRVSEKCRQQLRVEFFQMASNIELDPGLKENCQEDLDKFCSNVSPGEGQKIECLRKHQSELSPQCHLQIFKREKIEAEDNRADYVLMHSCKSSIRQYCSEEESDDILDCLTHNKAKLEHRCKKIVLTRLIERNEDYRLNPDLMLACKADIPKFCTAILNEKVTENHMAEGLVISCLKSHFKNQGKHLSPDCSAHIGEIIKEAAEDYRQDPILAKACKDEIQKYCLNTAQNFDTDISVYSRVEECLKERFSERKIKSKQCKKEIARSLAEGQADIMVDPLLHKACAVDLKRFCAGIPPGQGRLMSCMIGNLQDKSINLSQECHRRLSERVTMWQYAAQVAPAESILELWNQITMSSQKHYFFGVIFTFIGVLFIFGLVCGRVTKRIKAEQKNK